jgi:RNA polymerase sporulation-specific sigma factor
MLHDIVENMLFTLSCQEMVVIKLRYGLDDGICRTQGEIANCLDISNARVGQIELKALRKLRYSCRGRILKMFWI